MSNKFSTFICQNCGSETSQYFGRCLNCNEWNTIVEERKNTRSKITSVNKNKKSKLNKKKIATHSAVARVFLRVHSFF